MSIKHPIISVTGSSGAGTTSVRQTFDQIFRREHVRAAFVQGDAFHRYDRCGMEKAMKAAANRGNPNFSHFGIEANPLSWIIEQAGGRASTGKERMLDVVPIALHQKTPLICGSRDEVDRVMRIYSGQEFKGERSPLFGRRGLFRALP
jgi:hypothetical protein